MIARPLTSTLIVLAVCLAGAASARAQCCGSSGPKLKKGDERTPLRGPSISLSVKGLSKETLEKFKELLSGLKAIDAVEFKDGQAALSLAPRAVLAVKVLRERLKESEFEIEDAVLSGNVTLKVSGMSCAGCARRLDGSLRKLNGVTDLTIDLKSTKEGTVLLTASKPLRLSEIRERVKKTPFTLEDVIVAACCGKCAPGDKCCGKCASADKKDGCCGRCGGEAAKKDGCCGKCGAGK